MKILLTQPLELHIGGLQHGRLLPCPCEIPFLSETAASVNDAYTRLSVTFESGRRSHTGSVFRKVFVHVPEGGFRALALLREECLTRARKRSRREGRRRGTGKGGGSQLANPS